MHVQRTRKIKIAIFYWVLVVTAFVNLLPVIWSTLTSFKLPLQTFAIPPVIFFRPTLEGYKMLFYETQHALGLHMWKCLTNSTIIALLSTLFTITAACFGAYSLSRFYFKGKRLIAFVIIATRMLPPIGTIVPIFLLMISLGLLDTRWALIMAYTALNIPFAVWMLRGFMDEVPSTLADAALIDGCSEMGVLWWVIFPLVAPGIVATAVFSFLLSWSEFPLALVLTSTKAKTLPLIAVSFVTEQGILWAPMMAAATIALAPPVLFVILTHRGLAKGLTFGAVKG